MTSPRTVAVPLPRLDRWLAGFADRNGPVVAVRVAPDAAVLETDRGGTAVIPLDERTRGMLPTDPTLDDVATAIRDAHDTLAVVLIRRGGWAVATGSCRGDSHLLTATKHGQRYVQGRTAAGGQSQQRFARRRAGQAHALVKSAVDGAIAVLGQHPQPVDLLVTGGDRALLDELLAEPPLDRLVAAELRHVDIPDPRRRTLDEAVERARAVRIVVHNAEDRDGR